MGGEKSPVHSPYLVSVQYKSKPSNGFLGYNVIFMPKTGNYSHMCGACIVNGNLFNLSHNILISTLFLEYHIVTAAHCVYK